MPSHSTSGAKAFCVVWLSLILVLTSCNGAFTPSFTTLSASFVSKCDDECPPLFTSSQQPIQLDDLALASLSNLDSANREAALIQDSYYAKEKNVGLFPIIVVLSIIFGVGMVLLHAFAGKA